MRTRRSIIKITIATALVAAAGLAGTHTAHADLQPIPTIPGFNPPIVIAPNLLGNPGFEAPRVLANSSHEYHMGQNLGACGTRIAHQTIPTRCWRVSQGSAEVADRGFWPSFEGNQSVRLKLPVNGNSIASIKQAVPVTGSRWYQVGMRLRSDPQATTASWIFLKVAQYNAEGQFRESHSRGFGPTPDGRYTYVSFPTIMQAQTTHVVVSVEYEPSAARPGMSIIDAMQFFQTTAP